MSKRKRKSTECGEENKIQDAILPETYNRPLSSDEMYEDVLVEIKNCTDSIEKAKTKLHDLKDLVNDLFTTQVAADFDLVHNIVNKSVRSIGKSRKKWLTFNCLPQIPMRHILQYLSIDDKRNLRLTSISLKGIVDDELNKVCKIKSETINTNDSNSTSDIYFKYEQDDLATEAANALSKISDRVVEISGTADLFEELNDKKTNFSIVKDITIHHYQLPKKMLFQNLRVLKLHDLNIEGLDDGELLLNQLEELSLYDVRCSKGFGTLLSACRSIRYLKLHDSSMHDVFSADFNMPNLKKIVVLKSSPEFLYIMTGSAATLTDVFLYEVDPQILITSNSQFPNLSKLSLCYESKTHATSLGYLIAKFASSVQALELDVTFSVLHGSSPDFPKLERFSFDEFPMEDAIKMIKHSPKLKCVVYEDLVYPVTLGTDQPGALCLDAQDFDNEVDDEKFLEALNNPSRQIKELLFVNSIFDMPDLSSCRIVTLTKLILAGCEISSGFENLLNKCCSTLEELKLEDSVFEINGTISGLEALKHISIVFALTNLNDDSFGAEITKLLKACKDSLQKLTLELPDKISVYKVLEEVELPNLTIFRLYCYPRPGEKELGAILEQLPVDVALWLFQPEYLSVPSNFHPRVLKLMKVVSPHISYVGIS